MPCLICDLRPTAASLLDEYQSLLGTGEAVALFWPAIEEAPVAYTVSAQELQTCFENEQLAFVPGAELPRWLLLDEFHRILLISPGPALTPAERALADLLLARDAEAVEVLSPAAAADLAQSWASGRRTGALVLR